MPVDRVFWGEGCVRYYRMRCVRGTATLKRFTVARLALCLWVESFGVVDVFAATGGTACVG